MSEAPYGDRPKYCEKKANSPFWYYKLSYRGAVERGSTGCEDAREAAEYVSVRRANLIASVDGDKNNAIVAAITGERYRNTLETLTWEEALQCYHDEKSKGTDNERNCLRNAAVLAAAIGNISFPDLEHRHFYEFRLARLKEPNGRGGTMSPCSVNREIAHARQVFNHMEEKGYRMPAKRPNFGKLIDSEAEHNAARMRELKPDEEARLFEALEEVGGEAFCDFIEFLLLCGQRKAAAVNLCWGDLDWQNQCFSIKLKTRGTKKVTHTVPLTPRMIEIINRQPKAKGTDRVFTYVAKRSRYNPDGSYIRKGGERYAYTIGGWKKDWKKALEIAGVDDFRVHDLRHTNATRVVRQTGDIIKAQKILGHRNLSTTARYAHADLSDARDGLLAAEQARSAHQDDLKERKAFKGLRVVR